MDGDNNDDDDATDASSLEDFRRSCQLSIVVQGGISCLDSGGCRVFCCPFLVFAN